MGVLNAMVGTLERHDRFVVIIPASNEAGYIGSCLRSLLAQKDCPSMQIIVSANACTDNTVAIVNGYIQKFADAGHSLKCLDSSEGGKILALNRAEIGIPPTVSRLYLDADIVCAPLLVGQIARALQNSRPLYATGTLEVAPAHTCFTRAYARFWQSLPFVQSGAVGAGCFAVNGTGRARWGEFPPIISDDTFVRLHFSSDERIEVPALYTWPMIEGFSSMVRVRRRQDRGVAELRQVYPSLMRNEVKTSVTKMGLFARALQMPFAFIAYMAVHVAVRLKPSDSEWVRGR